MNTNGSLSFTLEGNAWLDDLFFLGRFAYFEGVNC